MKIKLHFGLLVILLAFLGTYLDQTTAPNQQIVIQFSDEDISKEDADITIEIVKQQLQSIGVNLIRIDQNNNGQLKIIYYSESDVSKIQRLLLKEHDFKFTYDSDYNSNSDVPKDERIKDYELNISEIHNASNINWDFERTEIVQFNQKSDHSDNPKIKTSGYYPKEKSKSNKISVAIKINTAIACTIDCQSYKIPEVRAGPNALGVI